MVTLTISFPTTSGTDTAAMDGTATGTSLAGTYTDTQGGAGTWTALPAGSLGVSYNGTSNSTFHPLLIVPTIGISLTQDASFTLTRTATIMSSPCTSSLTLSGQAIDGAFSLTDAASKMHILAVSANGTGVNFAFDYHIDTGAPSCSGDFGHGTVTNNGAGSWDY